MPGVLDSSRHGRILRAMSGEMHMLGHPFSYWIELQTRFETESGRSATKLLSEVVELRGRISFYEDRIEDMAKVMGMKK